MTERLETTTQDGACASQSQEPEPSAPPWTGKRSELELSGPEPSHFISLRALSVAQFAVRTRCKAI
jgi:hypothetical protein